MIVLLAVLSGGLLGYVLERGDLCFHSTLRGLFSRPRQLDLFRAYLLALLISIPLVNGMIRLGWIDPWIPPFAWQANITGGLLFGAGMVVAATCITGLFYKLGHGMAGTLVGLAAWAVGDVITYRGPLSPLRSALNASPVTAAGQTATVTNLLGPVGIVLLVGLGLVAIRFLWQSPRQGRGKLWDWLPLGLAVGLVSSLAWLVADISGSNYTFGTSSVPSGVYAALMGEGGGGSPWIGITLASLVPGAFIAARLSGTWWLRGESMRRYGQLAIGGFMMGVGAGIAGGCNLGHSLVGVPLLSLGSITSTLSMGLGVFLAERTLRWWQRSRQPDAQPLESTA